MTIKDKIKTPAMFYLACMLLVNIAYAASLEAEVPSIIQSDTINIKGSTSKPLDIEVNRPQDNSFVFENIANNLKIEGRTKPSTKVHLFVQRKALDVQPAPTYSLEIAGAGFLPNEVQQLKSAGLQIECKGIGSLCLDYSKSAMSDKNGNFNFKDVDLTPLISLKTNVRQTDLLTPEQLFQFGDTSAKLLLVASDGESAASKELNIRIGNCWSDDQAWSIATELQDPPLLSPERIAENTEEIYLLLKFNYLGNAVGTTKPPAIKKVSIAPACGDRFALADESKRFKTGCKLFGGARTIRDLTTISPDGTSSYSIIKLNRMEGMEKWIQKNWTEFFRQLGRENEATFPLLITITYNEDKDGDGIFDGEKTTTSAVDARIQNPPSNLEQQRYGTGELGLTQTSCHQVSYFVDSGIITPQDIMPDWILFDTADFLGRASKKLGEVDEKLSSVSTIVAGSCVGSYVLKIMAQTYRRVATKADELNLKLNPAKLLPGLQQNSENNEDSQHCNELINSKLKGKSLRDVSDFDLKKCFKRSWNAWELESKAYQSFRFSCDRLLGHSAPSRWTENIPDEDIKSKIRSNIQGCDFDQTVDGEPLTAEKCSVIANSNSPFKKAAANHKGSTCLELKTGDEEGLFVLSEQVKDNLYRFSRLEGDYKATSIYAAKVNDRYFITAPPKKTCADICRGNAEEKTRLKAIKNKDGTISLVDVKEKDSGKNVAVGCIRVNECRSLITKNERELTYKGITFNPGYSVEPKGYASDCFYEPSKGDAPKVVSNDPNEREECCCIIGDKGIGEETKFFDYKDADFKEELIHESEENDGQPAKSLDDMKFSYRYYTLGNEKDGFEVDGIKKKYNPNRYIHGRDFPACFGQDNLFLSKIEGKNKSVELNPYTQFTSSFQCAYISGIRRRLNSVKNMMDTTENCLVQIRKTGRADAGNCKEVFSTQLCGLFWQLVSSFTDKCSTDDYSGKSYGNSDTALLRSSVGGFRDSVIQSQSQFREEYSTAKTEFVDLLGVGAGSISRQVCLGALGYDWQLSLNAVSDLAFQTPSSSNVMPIAPKRRYVTFDLERGEPRYEYRSGIYIDPGCPISSYEVYVSCVRKEEADRYSNQIDCSKVKDPEGGSGCDCLQQALPVEPALLILNGGSLKPNVVEDKTVHKVITSPQRFDHIKVIIHPDPRIEKSARERCFSEGHEDGVYYFPIEDSTGRKIPGCQLDLAAGFTCTSDFSFDKYGLARFESVRLFIDGKETGSINSDYPFADTADVPENSKVRVEATLHNQKTEKCLGVKIEQTNIEEKIFRVPVGTAPLTIDVPDAIIRAERNREQITATDGIILERASSSVGANLRPFDLGVEFEDGDGDDSFSFESDDDKLKITQIADIKIENNVLVITTKGAIIAISQVQLQKNLGQERAKLSGKITVDPRPISSPLRNIILNVYNLKTGLNLLTTPDECDFNNRARITASLDERNYVTRNLLLSIRPETEPYVSGRNSRIQTTK